MVGRNIVVGGMSGGAGHVGMATQGYGGVFDIPAGASAVDVYLTSDEVATNLTSDEVVLLLTSDEVTVLLSEQEL